MVSPVLRRLPPHEYRVPPTTVKQTTAAMSVISPNTPSIAETPSTIGRITPTRRMLFDRTTSRDGPSVSMRSSIDSVESRQELEDLRRSCEKKDNQIRTLHQRFHTIQQGLGSIDQERNTLVEKAKKLEKEKRQIQRQLEIREQEIQALVQRCASQEEKMRESARLRSQNRELAQALETIQRQSSDDDQERKDLRSLHQKLQESELSREQLQERLRKVQREHDSIADTLQSCLAKIRQLTEEKEMIEEERRRERKRAEIELERQRLAHVQVSNELKDDIENKQIKIEQMERILQESMFTKTSLRREKAISEGESQKVLANYEKKIAELHEELNRRSDVKDDGYNETLLLLQKKIEEKDALMEVLEHEFSGQMGELMKKQSSLDEAEEEKKSLETKVQQLERLECQYSALEEYVRILDSNLADLTSENAHLMLDKEGLEEESATLQRQMKELEAQLNRTHQKNEEREGYFDELTSVQNEEIREQIEKEIAEAQAESAFLQGELAASQRDVVRLEEKLNEARDTISQKGKEIHHLQQEKNKITSTLQAALTEARKEVAQLEARVELQDQKLRSTQHSLRVEQDKHNQQENYVRQLESSLEAQAGSERLIREARSPSATIIDVERMELSKQIAETNILVESLQQQIFDIEEDAATQRDFTNETKARRAELERAMHQAQIHLRTLQEELYSLKLSSNLDGRDTEDMKFFTTRSEEESAHRTFQTDFLKRELTDARMALREKEAQIDQLHVDVAQARIEKESLLESLEEANGNIMALHNDSGRHTEEHIEKKLESALAALSEQINKTRKIEEEYSSAVKQTSQREVYNRQTSSRLVVLENQIVDLKEKKAELTAKLKASEQVVASKDQQLKRFELETEEWEHRVDKLNGELDEEKNRRLSLENQVAKKNEINLLIQSELDGNTKERETFEKRIKEMDQALLENHQARLEVEQKLTESTTMILSLEGEISVFRSKTKSLEEQLQAALKGLSDNEAFSRDAELRLAEKSLEFSQMEKEYEFATQSKQKMAERLAATEKRLAFLEETTASHNQATESMKTEIEESSLKLAALQADKAALQGQVESLAKQLSEGTKTSEETYQVLESQHAKACNSLFEKQSQIDLLESSIQRCKDELDSVQRQLSDAKEAIELLTKDNSTRERRIQGLSQELEDVTKNEHEVKTAFAASEEKHRALEKMLQQALAENEKLFKDLEDKESRVRELDEKLDQSEKENTVHSERAAHSAQKCVELEDRIKDLDQLIDSRETQLYTFGNDLSAAQAALSEATIESANLKEVVKSLETSLAETTKRAKCVQEELEIHLSEERGRYDHASSKLADVQIMLSEQRQKASRYQDMVSEQDDKIESLTSELREAVTSKDKALKSMETNLKNQILKLETDLALKEDEIQELRVVELKDKEETIAALSDALEKLQEQTKANEAALTNDLNETRRENIRLRATMEEQERDGNIKNRRFEEEVTKMEGQIKKLEEEKRNAEAVIEEQDGKLRDRGNVISELTRREAELEKHEQVLLDSSEQLVKSERLIKEDLERMKLALDVQILRSKESMDYQRQELETKARKERAELSYKLRSVEMKLGETENVLKERTSLLSEMVEHNRDLECRLEKQQAQIDAMEEETSRCRVELSETQSELMRSREDLCKRENALTAKLNEERSHRDIAERALSKIKVQFKDAAVAKKMISDLEKDNNNLKDKVARQEAYLQRKLQKDKIHRGGITSMSSSASTSSSRTPIQRSSPHTGVPHTPPRIVQASSSREPGSGSRIPSMSSSQNSDSSRSSRSISSIKTLPRSNIPTAGSTSSVSMKMDSRNTSNTGRGSSSTPVNANNALEPIQRERDSWELDVE